MKTFGTVHGMTTTLSQQKEGLCLTAAAAPPVSPAYAREQGRQAESDAEIHLP